MLTSTFYIYAALIALCLIFGLGILHRHLNIHRTPSTINKIITNSGVAKCEYTQGQKLILPLGSTKRVELILRGDATFLSVSELKNEQWILKEGTLSIFNDDPITLRGPWKKEVYNLLREQWNEVKYL